jgi:GntR family transcriptional regulator, transcriptional repressor for pyruvate dehydrogenase complex
LIAFPSAQRQTLASQVAMILKGHILQAPLEEGTTLPAERYLAEALNISRTTLREALSQLLGAGVLERTSSGSLRIAAFDRARVAGELNAVDSSDVYDLNVLRFVIEVGAVELVARQATAAQVQEIEAWVIQGEQRIAAGETWTREDVGFHVALLRAVGSPAVSAFIPLLEEAKRRIFFWQLHELRERLWPDDYRSMAEHRALLEALKRHDAESARLVMLAHLSPYLDQRWYQWNKTALTKPAEVETTDAPASSAMSKIPGRQGGLL